MKTYKIKLINGETLEQKLKENEEFLEAIYGKNTTYGERAKVINNKNGAKDLISYETRVARITKSGDFIRLWDGYSNTTLKHINEFRMQNNMPSMNKAEWDKMPVNKTSEKKWIIKIVKQLKNGKEKEFVYEENQSQTAINKAVSLEKDSWYLWRSLNEQLKENIQKKQKEVWYFTNGYMSYERS